MKSKIMLAGKFILYVNDDSIDTFIDDVENDNEPVFTF